MSDIILMAGGSAALLAAVTPALLPGETVVERRTLVSADPATVFALLQSSEGYQTFNPYCDTDPNLKIDFFGPADGIGAGFRFEGREGRGTQTIVALEENRRVEMELDLGPMGCPRTTFTLEPHPDGGTEVVWSTVMAAGLNPLKRIFGLFADRLLGPTYERGLQNLHAAVA
ncbi:MAG: SRPBCC family protein [Myxococcota bacterium]